MCYIIGVDSGGTSTKSILLDVNDYKYYTSKTGPSNILSNGKEQAIKNITDSIVELMRAAGRDVYDCKGICIGGAGISSQVTQEFVKNALKDFLNSDIPVLVENDAKVALAAANGRLEGVVVISGTGSIAFGIDKWGNERRCGGWGHILGDEGSGYWIGKRVIEEVIKYHDGRGGSESLYYGILNLYNISKLEDLKEIVYSEDFTKDVIAKASKIADMYMEDDGAMQILQEAGDKLAELAYGVINGLDLEEIEIGASGSVLLNDKTVYNRFCSAIWKMYPQAVIHRARYEARVGALIILSKYLHYDFDYEKIFEG